MASKPAKLKVLLVDQDPDRALRMRAALEAAQCRVVGALCAARDILTAAACANPHVVIIETDSPLRDVVESLAFTQSDAARPVVMFTGDTGNAGIRTAMEAGVSAYVVDGLSPQRLLPVLDVALERFAAEQSLRRSLADGDLVKAESKRGTLHVFGRGGEECTALAEAGIAHEVINGITAGLAAPSSIGIPLTHRDVCHGAILLTGHAGEDAKTGPDWRALAATGLPLVIYMGVARAAAIRAALLDAGMCPATPVAVIAHATRRSQRELVSTLHGFVDGMQAVALSSPAIIVVGETVRYANIDVQTQVLVRRSDQDWPERRASS